MVGGWGGGASRCKIVCMCVSIVVRVHACVDGGEREG